MHQTQRQKQEQTNGKTLHIQIRVGYPTLRGLTQSQIESLPVAVAGRPSSVVCKKKKKQEQTNG